MANLKRSEESVNNGKREDNYEERRTHLKNLSDEQLKDLFWELGEQMVEPLLKLGREHTTPSIERSILLRMGFSSTEAMTIVTEVLARGLIGKGAGHVVYKLSKAKGLTIREAGVALCNDQYWDEVVQLFKEAK